MCDVYCEMQPFSSAFISFPQHNWRCEGLRFAEAGELEAALPTNA
jgi:hypothetical protein